MKKFEDAKLKLIMKTRGVDLAAAKKLLEEMNRRRDMEPAAGDKGRGDADCLDRSISAMDLFGDD